MATREGTVGPADAPADALALAPIGVPAAVAAGPTDRPRSFYVDERGHISRDLHPRELIEVARQGKGALWVDIDATDRHQHALLELAFHFHPLAIEDTLNPQSRVKVEEFPDHLFVIVRGVQFCDTTEDPYDVETQNLCFFLSRNLIVTSSAGGAPAVEAVRERLERAPDLLARGPERVMHAIMDSAVDAYFPILDRLDEFVDQMEERIFTQFDETALRDIFTIKRLVLSLRRHLAPQREVFNVLTNRPSPFLSRDAQVYFRDIYDHMLRINDSLDTYRELFSNTLDSYLSQVSNRLGLATKGLSLAATLSVPFVMVSGMWGMNFAHIPLSAHRHGFAIMMAIQLALGVGLVAILRWRKVL